MSTFTLLSHWLPTERENYQELADLLLPNRDRYCAAHGYTHIKHAGPYFDSSLYYAVQRLHLLLDLMNGPNATEFYWVLNIQSIITNPSVRLESFVDETHDFWAHGDINAKINTGSFIVRNSEWGRLWIRFLIEDVKTHSHCWFENQSVIRHCESSPWREKIKIMPHPGLNSYLYAQLYNRPDCPPGQWYEGDFVLSLPGLDLAQRLSIVRSDAIQAIIA